MTGTAAGNPVVFLAPALAFSVAAVLLVPRLADQWIPPNRGGWSWPKRLSIGAITAATATLLTCRHNPHQPGEYLLAASWLTFTAAGILLSVIDIAAQRLPTPIITVAAATIGLLLAARAMSTQHSSALAVPVLAGLALGGGYLLFAAAGITNVGMGDVRLAALTGLILGTGGWHTVITGAAAAYLLAAPVALAALRRSTGALPSTLPFGPFLVAGTLLAGVMAPTPTV